MSRAVLAPASRQGSGAADTTAAAVSDIAKSTGSGSGLHSESDSTSNPLHCWLYVHLGPDSSFFIEATTGERRQISDARYTEINAIWNQVGLKA